MSHARFRPLAALSAFGLALSLLTGCWGAWSPRGESTNTSQSRYVYEYVPNAVLAVEDTSPEWRNGRHVFQRGPDRLLVLTRITSWIDRPSDKPSPQPPITERTDRLIERIWITIPLDIPVGQVVKLEDLNRKFLVGYDSAELPSPGKFFIQAVSPEGTVQMLEQRDDAVVIQFNVIARPKKYPDWRINETITVPVAPNGIHAREYVNPNRVASPSPATQPETTTQPAEAAATQPADAAPADASAAGATTRPGGKMAAVRADDRPIVGRWINDEKMNPFEIRMQFQDDGKFVYASTRGGGDYAPGMKYGAYAVKDGFVVMEIERYEFDTDHMRFLNKTTLTLRILWIDDDLVLDGDFGGHEKQMTLRLRKAEYPDMRFVKPPRGRSGKLQF